METIKGGENTLEEWTRINDDYRESFSLLMCAQQNFFNYRRSNLVVSNLLSLAFIMEKQPCIS